MGESEKGIPPRLSLHKRCVRLDETVPVLQHFPNRKEDMLKMDAGDEGVGG